MASKLFYRSSVKYARPFKVYRVKIRSLYIFQFCIQNSDSRHKNAWMLLTSSASNTKEDKFEHIPSEARQLRNRNLTVLWRTCKSREINKGRTMFCFFPYRSMTASSLRGWSQSDDSCVTLLLYKQSKRKLASVLHSDHFLKGPFPTLMQRSRLFLFCATAFV